MTKGHWSSRRLTHQERKTMDDFLFSFQTRYRFPKHFQRKDAKCGNVTYLETNYFRALCNPKGPTPCCFRDRCVRRVESECTCSDCYDLRQERYADYSNWIPADSRCPYRAFSSEEACALLKGSSIHFVGDSLVRHIYTALLLVLSGDMDYGALKSSASQETRSSCRGLYMFTEKVCRINLSYATNLCGGQTRLVMKYYAHTQAGRAFLTHVKTITNQTKSLILTGIGIHNGFNITQILPRFIGPVIQDLKPRTSKWPFLIWANTHAPGLFKSPSLHHQTRPIMEKFNSEMVDLMAENDVPVFETFNLTDWMSSFDGEHYGRGINVVKANILLHYIAELKRKGLW
ncbi:uncharacterized protein [Haliotis cracherodii]|uniref:uncharacterized protein n=1 Tax=Haliotis cracherodii TaxID=6455 RepID=UPI0039EC9C2D